MKRSGFLFLFVMLGLLSLCQPLHAQTVLFTTKDETQKPRLFFKSSTRIVFTWAGGPSSVKLKLGTLPGIYRSASIPVNGSSVNVLPDSLSLPVGRYYAIVTNSDSSTLAGIQTQMAANSQIVVSNQTEFIIESQSSPSAVAPIGVEPNNTPLFRWTSVPGVPAYQVILSKTPFQVTRDPATGELSVIGANLVWRYITKTNSALYGSVNANSKYNTITPAPLISGNEYNYTILNVYDEDGNPAYTSDVFGGVVSFKYTGAPTIQSPVLKSPLDNTTFYGDDIITFKWDPVPNANLYTLYLFERVTTTTGAKQEYDVPLWNSTTTSTVIDYHAESTLASGKYLWYISVSDAGGNGNSSVSSIFNYSVPMGHIRIEAVSAPQNAAGNLVGFEARARAIVGGATPTDPFITTNDRFINDSVVVGTYQFTGSKLGYADTTVTLDIPIAIANSTPVSVVLPFRPLPATISGSVVDQAGKPVAGALAQVQNLLTGNQRTAITSSAGQFSIGVEDGSYSAQASKAGYIPSATLTISAGVGEQKILPFPLQVQSDEATLSGAVVNDAGAPIVLATVSANASTSQGLLTQSAITNSSGNFSFNLSATLSSGIWSITAARDGFVPAPPRQVNLTAGQSKQLDNIILLPNANTINGNVYELVTSGSQSGTVPLPNATVTATPATGAILTTTTSQSGQFSLSLKQGTYRMQVARDHYSVAPASQSQYDVTVTVGQTVSGINFTLRANPSSISGSVLLSDGTPVSGAAVTTGSGGSTQSLQSGAYTLSVAPGTFTLASSRDGYSAPQPVTVSVTVGQNLQGVNFQMSPNAGVISGNVQSGGASIAGAVISALNTSTNDSISANAAGTFSISVQPGTWKVTANKSGFVPSSSTFTVGPGQRSSGNLFNLVPNIATISGVVSDGITPIRSASVSIYEFGASTATTSTASQNDGSFAATVTAGKAYSVIVSQPGYATKSSTTQSLASGTTVSLPFTLIATPSSVSGIVQNNLSAPLFPAKVYLITASSQFLDSATTSNTGAYRLGMSAGSYFVLSRLPGYVSDSVAVAVNVGQSLNGINLRLTENFAVLSGSLSSGGTPISGALINISGDKSGATVTSAGDGSFIVPKLIGGVYSIKISESGFADTTFASVFRDGESKRLTIEMTALNGKINGVLRTSGGVTVAGATVFARHTSGRSYSTVSGNSGTFSISSLPLGAFAITAAKSGYSSSKIDSLVLSKSSLTVNSIIADFSANALRVRGKVTDATSAAGISTASVAIAGTLGSGSGQSTTTGDYALDNLAQATDYVVTVSKSGYATVSKNATASLADTLAVVDVQLTPNIGIISGSVKDIAGAALPFTVSVKATSSASSYAATTDASGNFSFSGVAKDNTYTVATDLFRAGYDNVSATVPFPISQASVTGVALVVEPKTGEVKGSAGVSDALVELTESSGKISARILNSLADNSYAFSYLPSGSYTVTPAKEGFTFSPATQSLTLSSTQKATLPAFGAVADTGSILVKAVDFTSGAGMSGVAVTLVSSDTSVLRSLATNALGEALFTQLPARGRTYIVHASHPGYSADLAQATATLATNGLVTLQFRMTANTSSLAGKVVRSGTGTTISSAQIAARRSTGEQLTEVTDASGNYKFSSLPADDFALVASKPGFRSDTIKTTVALNENKTVADLTLTPTTVSVHGSVLYDGAGVANLNVSAVSATSLSTQTDQTGNFVFNDLPIQVNVDTTVYSIVVEMPGLAARTATLLIPASQVGQSITVPPILLPSGKIRITVTDGKQPVEGAKVLFTPSNGSTIEWYTKVDGVFESSATLEHGIHRFSISKDPYLSPSQNALSVALATDTTKMTSLVLSLPFRIVVPTEITASDDAAISLVSLGLSSADTAWLYYKRESQSSFAAIAMDKINDSTLSGMITAQFSTEKLTYFAEVKRDTVIYSSTQTTIVPTARGIISYLDFDPSLDRATLRQNDVYTVRLVTRDGANLPLGRSLLDQARGKILWRVDDSTALTIVARDTTASIATNAREGVFTISVTATLNNISMSQSFSVNVAKTVLTEISIGGLPPGGELNNSSRGIQLTIGGRDTSGKSVSMGESVQWNLSPAGAGSIDLNGFLTVDSTMLGKIVVTATDGVTKLSQKITISVVATIDSSRSFFLTDKNGMQILIPKKAVGAPIDLQLEDASFGPAKKFVFLKNTGQNFVASPNLCYLTYKGDALSGDSLKNPASFQLTVDVSLKFLDGEKMIGLYDPAALEWKVLPASPVIGSLGKGFTALASGGVLQTNVLSQLKAQYTILSLNEPLGLKHVAVLPNPFSPVVAPLKIGYVVSTTDQQVLVSIQIYNIRAELVRTILDGDVQYPGRYGSRTSPKEITWDGKTNDGSLARNGRYIVQIRAKDSSGEKSELLQVILVK